MNSHWRDTPIYIPNRNNLERGFRRLVEWLQAAGMTRIVIIDNGSTYPPLLEYYRRFTARRPRGQGVEVHFALRNLGPNAPWAARQYLGLAPPSMRFVVTDPDVVPAPECPLDLVRQLHATADYYRGAKVGPALRIDNLPDSYARKREVLAWEKQFWTRRACGNCFQADIDTTFALYGADSPRWPPQPQYRLDWPYVIEHVPWYEDSAAQIPERDFYRSTVANDWSHW